MTLRGSIRGLSAVAHYWWVSLLCPDPFPPACTWFLLQVCTQIAPPLCGLPNHLFKVAGAPPVTWWAPTLLYL